MRRPLVRCQVLLDALLLSRCDFLLKTTSAVPEFAIWVNLRLHAAHVDLQWEDRFASQTLPPWAAHIGANNAAVYCAALERGCAMDTRRGGVQLLQPGQQCARCVPAVRDVDTEAALGAHAVTEGTRCDAPNELRLLSMAECIAYARSRRVDFLGSQRELGEFPGCIHWSNNLVEFNAHDQQRGGCNLGGKGKCICTRGANGSLPGADAG